MLLPPASRITVRELLDAALPVGLRSVTPTVWTQSIRREKSDAPGRASQTPSSDLFAGSFPVSMDGRSDQMLHWLGTAAREARVARGRLQVHIAATLGVNQETVGKFERGLRWPRDPDAMIAAYAEDLDIRSIELWEDALRRWTDSDRTESKP